MVQMTIKRGPDSWAYIYIALGFAVSIEGTIIQMVAPLLFPWNVGLYIAIAAVTIWAFLDNRWLQNKLVGMKLRFEEKER